MSKSSYSEVLPKFDNLIRVVANKCRINGVLLPDDLYQEGVLVLCEVLNEFGDKDKEELEKILRNRIVYRAKNLVKHHQTKKKDWRKSVSFDGGFTFNNDNGGSRNKDSFNNQDAIDFVDVIEQNFYLSPYEYMEHRDLERFFDLLIDKLSEDNDSDSIQILSQLIYPDIVEEGDFDYERLPKHMSFNMLCITLNFSFYRVRSSMDRIRKKCIKLAPQFDIYIPKEFVNEIR